ncbi:MAG TPA: hypothetical protein VGW36_08545 [Pyrinomonadaceae bacterium]|nr:hypothetical protein [Pyrinomonadaceae bacterium]
MTSKKTLGSDRRRRRLITFTWAGALTVLVFALIYWEQTAVLYILATLGVTALLIVVALSDLGRAENVIQESPNDDSAAIGSGIASTFGSNKS